MASLDHTDLEVVWLKDDQNLFLDHRMKILPSGMLEISDIRISDRAEYRCNASNEDTYKLSKIGHLRLNLDMGKKKPLLSTPYINLIPTLNDQTKESGMKPLQFGKLLVGSRLLRHKFDFN